MLASQAFQKRSPKLSKSQISVINDLYKGLNNNDDRKLVELIVNSELDKLVIASQISAHAANAGKKVLFLASSKELIECLYRCIHEFGLECGIISPKIPENKVANIQVANSSSIRRRKYWMNYHPDIIFYLEGYSALSKKVEYEFFSRINPQSIRIVLSSHFDDLINYREKRESMNVVVPQVITFSNADDDIFSKKSQFHDIADLIRLFHIYRKAAYAKGNAPIWAEKCFWEKCGRYPENQWCRGSTLGLSPSNEEKISYLSYLQRSAVRLQKDVDWIEEEFEKECGMGTYVDVIPKKTLPQQDGLEIEPENILSKFLKFFGV